MHVISRSLMDATGSTIQGIQKAIGHWSYTLVPAECTYDDTILSQCLADFRTILLVWPLLEVSPRLVQIINNVSTDTDFIR